MSVRTFYALNSLVSALDAIADSVDILTVDLFDTLVIRRIADPDQVKIPVARYIAARAEEIGVTCSWQTCLKWRAQIERDHRRKHGAIYPDHEACYPEFMSELLVRIFGNRSPHRLLQEVTDWELKLEQFLIVPRTELVNLIRRWHTAGKRIWIMTDIYLPSSHIRPLVEHVGLLPFLTGIVSSADESMVAKASGTGFRRLQEQQRLDPALWAHVGDNMISDGVRPAALNIRAFVLQDTSQVHRKALYRRYERAAAARPFWKGRLVQQLMLPLEGENIDCDSLYGFGYHFFGPLAGGFIQHLAARASGLRRMYFLSREGLMLMKAWERAVPWLFPAGGAPEVRYLYVSRMALASATCARRGLTRADAFLALLPAGNCDLRDIFRVFGLSMDELMPFLERHGLRQDSSLRPFYAGWTPDQRYRFDILLKDGEFQEAVKRQTREQGCRVERYLEQEGLFELPEVGIVDIGWLGTIQRFLHEAIAHRPDKPKLRGFLLGATRGIPYPTCDGNTIEGFIYDHDRSATSGYAITYALNIFEEAFRAPHAGIMGYAQENGRGQPIFQPETHPERIMEIEQDTYYAPLQKAIPEAVERYVAAATFLGLSAPDVLPWLTHMVTMRLAFPGSDELRCLQLKHHVDQYNGEHLPPLRIKLLYLLRLWDLKPWMMKIPGLRLGFYGWMTMGSPILRRAINLWHRLKKRIRMAIKRENNTGQD